VPQRQQRPEHVEQPDEEGQPAGDRRNPATLPAAFESGGLTALAFGTP